MDEDDRIYELSSIVAVVRQGSIVIVLLTVLAAGAALVASLAQSDRYESTATLLFRAPGLDAQIFDHPVLFGGGDVPDADTNIGLLSTDTVSERTELALDGAMDAGEISEAVSIREGAGPELVEVTASVTMAEDAALLANAYARSFLTVRRAANREDVERARRSVERELAELPARLKQTSQAAGLRRQIDELRTLEVLQTANAELVDEADTASSPTSPKTLRNTVLAGFVGLIFGMAAAFLLERLRGQRGADSRSRG